MSLQSDFENAVATFHHGDRYDRYLPLVRMGLNALGGDAEAVATYIMTNAPSPSPDPAKVREAIRYALDHDRAAPTRSRRKVKFAPPPEPFPKRREKRLALLPRTARDFVHVLLMGYCRTTSFTGTATADIIRERIRMDDAELKFDETSYRRQAADQLRAMHGGATVWAGTIGKGGKTPFAGNGIVDADELAVRIERGDLEKIPTHVSLNPLTGREGANKSGGASFDCLGTVATFRHVLLEFDHLKDAERMPSDHQIDIVAGLIDYAQETGNFRIVCASYTGGKSIHVVLRVPDGDLSAYCKQCAALADLFASSEHELFRIDTSGWMNNDGFSGTNAITHVRLAGATRPETGRRQRLLWCE